MKRGLIFFVIVIVLAGGFAFWWYHKFPQPYGAYTQHGVYYKPLPPISDSDNAHIPDSGLRDLIFGTDPTLASSYDASQDATRPGSSSLILVHVDRPAAALYDEYLQYFKGDGWTIDTNDGYQLSISAHKDIAVTVTVLPDGDQASNVRIKKQ